MVKRLKTYFLLKRIKESYAVLQNTFTLDFWRQET